MLSDRALRRQPTSRQPRAVRLLEIASVAGTLFALYLILRVPPSTIWVRAVLVIDLGATATSAASLVAYRLSFRLYQSRREQGDVNQAVRHGLVTGVVIFLLLGLQLLRLLHPVSLAVLLAGFLIGQVYVLVRRP